MLNQTKYLNIKVIYLYFNIVLLFLEKTRLINENLYLLLIGINSILLLFLLFYSIEKLKNLGSTSLLSIILFVLYCIISIGWSDYVKESSIEALKLCNIVLVLLFILTNESHSLKVIKSAMNIGVIVNLIFIILFPQYAIDITGEWKGIYYAKNTLASYLLLTFMINTYYYKVEKKYTFFYFVWSIILFYLIVRADSVAVIFLFVGFILINLFLFLLLKIKNIKLKIATFFILVGSVVLLIFPVYYLLNSLLTYLGKDITRLTGRDVIWDAVIQYSLKSPIVGHGYGGVWIENGYLNSLLFRYMEGFSVFAAHNSFLDIFVNVGLVGVTIFLFIVGVFFINSLKLYFKSNEYIYISLFIITIVQNLTETRLILYIPIYLFIFLYLTLSVTIKLSMAKKDKC